VHQLTRCKRFPEEVFASSFAFAWGQHGTGALQVLAQGPHVPGRGPHVPGRGPHVPGQGPRLALLQHVALGQQLGQQLGQRGALQVLGEEHFTRTYSLKYELLQIQWKKERKLVSWSVIIIIIIIVVVVIIICYYYYNILLLLLLLLL